MGNTQQTLIPKSMNLDVKINALAINSSLYLHRDVHLDINIAYNNLMFPLCSSLTSCSWNVDETVCYRLYPKQATQRKRKEREEAKERFLPHGLDSYIMFSPSRRNTSCIYGRSIIHILDLVNLILDA